MIDPMPQKKRTGLTELTCRDDPTPDTVDLVDDLTDDTAAEAAGTARNGDMYQVTIELVGDDTIDTLHVEVIKNGGEFCWATTDVVVS